MPGARPVTAAYGRQDGQSGRVPEGGPPGAVPATALEGMARAPWKYGFLPLLRRFGAQHADQPPIGQASRPQQEPLRLGQRASLAFAPREIAEVVLPAWQAPPAHAYAGMPAPRRGNNPDLPVVRVFGLGLLGPNGPLPIHYTEIVRERWENQGDPTLADFLDLFHHRYLTLIYRAWAQGQAAAGLDRAQDERFSRYIAWLTGHDLEEIRRNRLPSHARLAAAPHLSSAARHPAGLAGTLAHFFKVRVELQEFVMHWIEIEPTDHTRLGHATEAGVLARGAIAGELVPDRQNKFRLVIGPLTLADYLRFTPRGSDLPMLVEWVRAFVGHEFAWEVELRVYRHSAPPARLEDKERLGWTTWLGGAVLEGGPEPAMPDGQGVPGARPTSSGRGPDEVPRAHAVPLTDYAVGMVFEPERYLDA